MTLAEIISAIMKYIAEKDIYIISDYVTSIEVHDGHLRIYTHNSFYDITAEEENNDSK